MSNRPSLSGYVAAYLFAIGIASIASSFGCGENAVSVVGAPDATADGTTANAPDANRTPDGGGSGEGPGFDFDAGAGRPSPPPYDASCTQDAALECCNGAYCNGICQRDDAGGARCGCFGADGGCPYESASVCCFKIKACANVLACSP